MTDAVAIRLSEIAEQLKERRISKGGVIGRREVIPGYDNMVIRGDEVHTLGPRGQMALVIAPGDHPHCQGEHLWCSGGKYVNVDGTDRINNMGYSIARLDGVG